MADRSKWLLGDAPRKPKGGTAQQKRRYHLKSAYGMTPSEFEQTFADQGGVCAVCKRPPANYRLNVDHSHKTGLVRGLLCWNCNKRMGTFRDNLALLKAVVLYLEERDW